MPGLFDNSPGPAGGILGGLTATLFPGVYHQQVRDQAIKAYKDAGFSDSDAALAVNDPQQFQNLFQQRIFMQQLQEQQQGPNRPGLTESLYNIQHPGPEPFGTYTDPSGGSGPGIRQGLKVTPPYPGYQTPQPGPPGVSPSSPAGASAQASPGIGASPNPGLPPQQQKAIEYKSALKGAEETAAGEAKARPALPEVLTESDSALQQIYNLQHHPAIESATGTFLGRNPLMTGPVKDFASRFDQLRSSALFQTILQSKADTGKAGSAGLTYAASGKLIDPFARALPTADFKKALTELGERISSYKKNAWTAAGSPQDQASAANSFTPKEFHYNDFNPGPGWHQNSRTGQYRDPNGNIYDQYGNPATQVK